MYLDTSTITLCRNDLVFFDLPIRQYNNMLLKDSVGDAIVRLFESKKMHLWFVDIDVAYCYCMLERHGYNYHVRIQ